MSYLKIRSRNKSTHMLDKTIKSYVPVVYRAGSTKTNEEIFGFNNPRFVLEINTAKSCKISGNKINMKQAFDTNPEIIHAPWTYGDNIKDFAKFPAIIKHINSSRGQGIYMINTKDDLDKWLETHSPKNHIIEQYFTYSREYRLHICNGECFHAVRKMLKTEAKERWHRHNSTCVCILPENPLFNKPDNWEDIVKNASLALQATGLTIGAVDVKIQAKENPKWIILETNSAPSLKDITLEKYKEQLIKILKNESIYKL